MVSYLRNVPENLFTTKDTKGTKVFVGCASRTGQSRNISRKDAKAAKVGKDKDDGFKIIYLSIPNLASFASLRE